MQDRRTRLWAQCIESLTVELSAPCARNSAFDHTEGAALPLGRWRKPTWVAGRQRGDKYGWYSQTWRKLTLWLSRNLFQAKKGKNNRNRVTRKRHAKGEKSAWRSATKEGGCGRVNASREKAPSRVTQFMKEHLATMSDVSTHFFAQLPYQQILNYRKYGNIAKMVKIFRISKGSSLSRSRVFEFSLFQFFAIFSFSQTYSSTSASKNSFLLVLSKRTNAVANNTHRNCIENGIIAKMVGIFHL